MYTILCLFVVLAIFFACCWVSYLAGREHNANFISKLMSENYDLKVRLKQARKNDSPRDPANGRFRKR